MQKIKITKEEVNTRLDVFLQTKFNKLTRSHIKNNIENGEILVNDIKVKAGYSLKVNDEIKISDIEIKEPNIKAENIKLDIVYEDQDLAVINKPQGMVVHPAVKNTSGTLVNALLYNITDLSGINGVARPGIVHRLDKDTSGLLVVAKNDFAHVELSKQLEDKTCSRVYWALVEGHFKESTGVIETCLNRDKHNRLKYAVSDVGKRAITLYRTLEDYKGYSLVEFILKTGRTHQIRVHSAYMGHAIVGDAVYNTNKCRFPFLKGQLLHAKVLGFVHPRTKQKMEFCCELPDYFSNVLKILGKNN